MLAQRRKIKSKTVKTTTNSVCRVFFVYVWILFYILYLKLMVGEKSGLIRIYNVDTLKPLFTLMCNGFNTYQHHNPLLSFDWSESNPEFVVGSTLNTVILWNTFNSWFVGKFLQTINYLSSTCEFVKLFVNWAQFTNFSDITVINSDTLYLNWILPRKNITCQYFHKWWSRLRFNFLMR